MHSTGPGVVFDFEDKKAHQELSRTMAPSTRATICVGKYYGYGNLRIGVALSGNGAVLDDGTDSAAEHSLALTSDRSEAKL